MSNRYLIWGLAFSIGLNLMLLGMVGYHVSAGIWTPARASVAQNSPMTHALQFDEKRLSLTPEQREAFRGIRERWNKGEQKAKKEGESRIKRLSVLLVRDDVTTETMSPIFQEFSRHSDGFFVRLSGALQEYRAELDPRQRAIFSTMLQERFTMLQRLVNRKNFEYEQRMTATMQRERKGDSKTNKRNEKKTDTRKNTGKTNRPEKQPGKPAVQRPEKQPGQSPVQRPENRRQDEKPSKAS